MTMSALQGARDGRARLIAGDLPWIIAGVIGWAGVGWIGWSLWQSVPPRAGFDLVLLLDGARALAAGHSPYDPSMLAGTAPGAADLFYSYPPPVAQAMTLVSGLPNGVVLLGWAVGATIGLAAVAWAMARAGAADPRSTALRAVAIAPLILPFAIAILFGNLDAWFPLAYGAVVVGALPGASRRTPILAGVAVALATIAKLHPAPLLAWLAGRVVADRGGSQARVLVAAVVAGLVVAGLSLAIGGAGPWQDYVAVVRAGAGAGLVDPRNIGPVSLLGQVTALDAATLRIVAGVVGAAALLVAAIAGLRVRDPLLGVTVAATASLVTLPVTWYHYPVALVPSGIALAIRYPASRPWLVVAIVVADIAIGPTPLLWLAVALVVFAAWWAGRGAAPAAGH